MEVVPNAFKNEKDMIEDILILLIKDYDVIFHIDDLNIPIENNGIRETDADYRKEIAKEIEGIIEEYGTLCNKIIKVSGTTKERVNQVKASLSL